MRRAAKCPLAAIALVLAMASLLGCATGLPGAGASGPGRGAGGKPIRIGAVGPITGEASFFGISTKNGCELAIEEWNEAGGVFGRRLELIFEDDRGDPTEGAAAYEKLIEKDRVVGIVGAVMSKVSLAGAPLAQAAGIPMISPTSTNPKVTEVGDYIFRSCFLDPYQGTIGARFAYRDLGVRRAAALFDMGNDYTRTMSEFFKAEFERLGGKIVAFEAHQSGITDFKSQLTTIVRAKPELICLSDYYNDVALIAVQLRALGFTGPLLGGDGWDSPDLVKYGGEAIEGGFFVNNFSKDDTRPEVQSFVAKYRASFGANPDAFAASAYDAMQLMLEAIRRAGSTKGSAIRDALRAGEFDAVTGRISFDEKRNPIKSAVIIEIKGGYQVFRTTVHP